MKHLVALQVGCTVLKTAIDKKLSAAMLCSAATGNATCMEWCAPEASSPCLCHLAGRKLHAHHCCGSVFIFVSITRYVSEDTLALISLHMQQASQRDV
jgi:hypothetical protein